MAEGEFVVHTEPVWRERANFVINAELPEEDQPHRFEQLFARQVAGDRFEVCCIPFFLYDVALGDVVVAGPIGALQYVMSEVVEPSGHRVFRVWFGESFQPREEIADELLSLGALIEWSSNNLLAIDATDEQHAQVLADVLSEHERADHLVYEAGQS